MVRRPYFPRAHFEKQMTHDDLRILGLKFNIFTIKGCGF